MIPALLNIIVVSASLFLGSRFAWQRQSRISLLHNSVNQSLTPGSNR